jgi:CcmD family protein
MIDQSAQPVAAPSASTTPDDRSTSFRPVEGGTEMRSGTVLLVEAYAAIWLVLMVWLVMLWNKQRSLHGRLDDVERALARAEKARAGQAK